MSVLDVFAPRSAQQAQQDAPSAPMIEWSIAGSGRWTGRIGLDRAGEVRQTPIGYRLADWDGADLGTWQSLAEAKHHLEPGVRAALRAQSEPRDRPIASLLGTAAASATAAALFVSAAWFALQTL